MLRRAHSAACWAAAAPARADRDGLAEEGPGPGDGGGHGGGQALGPDARGRWRGLGAGDRIGAAHPHRDRGITHRACDVGRGRSVQSGQLLRGRRSLGRAGQRSGIRRGLGLSALDGPSAQTAEQQHGPDGHRHDHQHQRQRLPPLRPAPHPRTSGSTVRGESDALLRSGGLGGLVDGEGGGRNGLGLVLGLAEDGGYRDHGLVRLEGHDPDAGRIPALGRDLLDRGADQRAL